MMQGGATKKDCDIGIALWLIPFSGVGQLICYGSNRYYSNALYDAQFIQDLLDDTDEEEEEKEENDSAFGEYQLSK